MEILEIKALCGPNPWAGVPVLVVKMRSATAAHAANASIESCRRLLAWLPELARHAENVSALACRRRPAGPAVFPRFEQQLRGGLGIPEAVQYLAQILQMATGVDASFGETRRTELADVFEFAIQFEVESLARACLESAIAICRAAEQGSAFDFSAALRALVDLADDVCLGPSTRAIVQAAARRGIPCRRLSPGSLVMLGEGRSQRRICTAETDATSAIAEGIAKDKDLTKRLLHAVGVPVPRGRLVTSSAAAWHTACEIGTPVAIKPSQANHAQGVSLNLFSREQIEAAFAFAQRFGDETSPILVEQFIRGDSYRLLVVDDRLVAAARSEKEFLVGDGRHTIRQLLDEANRDPRRGNNYTDPLTLLELDLPTLFELEKQGLTPDSVPAANQRVLLHFVGDYTTDCTAEVHPETAAQAVLAARLIGLDVAGIDLVADDIGRRLVEQRGAILEVNAGPSLGMHVAPLHGQPQPVGEAIVARLFPAERSGRIPVFVVAGDGQRSANAQWLEWLLIAGGLAAGRVGPGGLFVAGQPIAPSHPTDFENAEAILLHPLVEAAIIELGANDAAERGLGCSRADVAIVTCPDNANASGMAIPTSQQPSILAAVHAVPPAGIAILPWCDWSREVLAPACRGKVYYYSFLDHSTGIDSDSPVCWVKGADVVLSHGKSLRTISRLTIAPGVGPKMLMPSLCGLWLSGLAQKLPLQAVENADWHSPQLCDSLPDGNLEDSPPGFLAGS